MVAGGRFELTTFGLYKYTRPVDSVRLNQFLDFSLTEKRLMPAKVFFDTNVLIYAVADDPRSTQAEELLASGGVLSVQILNEFASVARRKIQTSRKRRDEALNAFRVLCPSPIPSTVEIHNAALKIAEKHGYNILTRWRFECFPKSFPRTNGCGTQRASRSARRRKFGRRTKLVYTASV
jgi:predicted nucleic acid-binding protein